MSSGLDLTVSVPAEEWAYLRRRATYLEALLMRFVRDNTGMREWFPAAELAGMLLPGLPTTPEAVTRRASQEKWAKRKTRAYGRWFTVYHVYSLPKRAFDALVARLLDLPSIDDTTPLENVLPHDPTQAPKATAPNAAPPWVLPLMRIMKRETDGNLREAWRRLPEQLPPDVALPDVEEAATILVNLGILGSR